MIVTITNIRNQGSKKPNLEFTYDAAGNRMVRTFTAAACSSPDDISSSGKKGDSENETAAQTNNNSAISNDDSGTKNPKEKQNQPEIIITPNPTTGRAVIYFSPENITGLARLEVTDIIGQKVFVKEPFAPGVNNYVDLSHLQKGVYFLKIFTTGEVRVEKVVIE